MNQNNLLYTLADLFNTNIYEHSGGYRGVVPTDWELGGFRTLSAQVTICADEVSDKLVTAIAHLIKDLWVYVVITREGRWLLMFDNSKAKIRVGGEREFCHGNGMQTLQKLKPAITTAFSWENQKWVTSDPAALLKL